MLKQIIKLGAEWCAPCKVFGNTFHKVEKMDDYKNIEFKDVDIENDEEGDELVAKHNIRSVPTTLLLDENGNVLYKLMGNVSEQDFIELINNTINGNNN